ncbi:MAG: hypothetical protein Salg2KO_18690 [Salibacteraceae bacterium]
MVHGQIRIEGEVQHASRSLDEVTVQVVQNGKIVRTVSSNRRGKYSLDLAFNENYRLTYHRAFMVPISIDVNTTYSEYRNNELIIVPLNIELVYRYKNIAEPRNKCIGLIKQMGKGEDSFAFIPDEKVLADIKAMNKKSYELEETGAAPQLAKKLDEAVASKEPSTVSKDNSIIPPPIQEVDKLEYENFASKAKLNRQEVVAESKSIEVQKQQQEIHTFSSSNRSTSTTASDFLYDDKVRASNRAEIKSNEQRTLADNRVRVNDVYSHDLLASVNSKNPVNQHQQKVSSIKRDQGTFVSEESFSVYNGRKKSRYKHVTYHWIVFDVDYFYKDLIEITEQEYAQAKNATK